MHPGFEVRLLQQRAENIAEYSRAVNLSLFKLALGLELIDVWRP